MAEPKHSEGFAGAFDCIRLAAAAMVIWGHSYVLLGQQTAEPLGIITHGGTGLAEVAVYMFFAISGYLVTQSWQRDPSFKRFMMRRALRIIPALIFVIVLCFAAVGPFITTLSPMAYFSSPHSWGYLSKVLIYPTQYGLPGVFENNPYPAVVNGSLWSLRLEFSLYIVVAALGFLSIMKWRWVNPALVLGCVVMERLISQTHLFDALPFLHQTTVLFSNAVPFFVGAMMAQSNLSPMMWRVLGAAGMLLMLISVGTQWFVPCLLLTLPIMTITVARHGKCDLSRYGDYSYGLYLWGFVVQQCVIFFVPSITLPELVALSMAGALVMAVISWHGIEKRALRFKPKRALN